MGQPRGAGGQPGGFLDASAPLCPSASPTRRRAPYTGLTLGDGDGLEAVQLPQQAAPLGGVQAVDEVSGSLRRVQRLHRLLLGVGAQSPAGRRRMRRSPPGQEQPLGTATAQAAQAAVAVVLAAKRRGPQRAQAGRRGGHGGAGAPRPPQQQQRRPAEPRRHGAGEEGARDARAVPLLRSASAAHGPMEGGREGRGGGSATQARGGAGRQRGLGRPLREPRRRAAAAGRGGCEGEISTKEPGWAMLPQRETEKLGYKVKQHGTVPSQTSPSFPSSLSTVQPPPIFTELQNF